MKLQKIWILLSGLWHNKRIVFTDAQSGNRSYSTISINNIASDVELSMDFVCLSFMNFLIQHFGRKRFGENLGIHWFSVSITHISLLSFINFFSFFSWSFSPFYVSIWRHLLFVGAAIYYCTLAGSSLFGRQPPSATTSTEVSHTHKILTYTITIERTSLVVWNV